MTRSKTITKRGDDDVEDISSAMEVQLRTLMAQVEVQARDFKATLKGMDEMRTNYE